LTSTFMVGKVNGAWALLLTNQHRDTAPAINVETSKWLNISLNTLNPRVQLISEKIRNENAFTAVVYNTEKHKQIGCVYLVTGGCRFLDDAQDLGEHNVIAITN
jgi:hypothetical protein